MVEKKISINGININYKVFLANKLEKTFLILHGWGGESNSWIDVGNILSNKGYTVIIPDLPGFGKSKLNKVFTIENYANLIKKFYEKLDLQNVILLGHSNGGAISIKITSLNPQNIKKLILNNSAGIRIDRKRTIKRKILNNLRKVIPTFLKQNKLFKKSRNIFYRIIGGQDYINSEQIPFLQETYKNMISTDLQEEMREININTSLIWGENDSYTPLSDGKQINKLIKNSSLDILNNEKHGIHLQNPKRLVKTILKNI